MSFRVVVDFDKCESNALCMAAAPEVFEVLTETSWIDLNVMVWVALVANA